MRTLKLFLPLVFVLNLGARAQINVVMNQPSENQLAVYNIFTFQVINAGPETAQLSLEGSISLNNSQPVYNVVYSPVSVQPGVAIFNYSNLSVLHESYGNGAEAGTLRNTGLVPFGTYVICLKPVDVTTGRTYDNTCVEYISKPSSPPALVSPSNEAEIETVMPLLTWTPPTPIQEGSEVTYDLKISEILTGQNAYDALVRNPPVYEGSDIQSNSLLYPVGAKPLMTGSKYAWQVAARNGRYSLGSSEIWSFNIKQPRTEETPDKPAANLSYPYLKKSLDGSYAIAVESLQFACQNDYEAGVLNYKITDLSGEAVSTNNITLTRGYGDNRYSLDLKKTGVQSDKFYILKVSDPKGEQGILMFKYYSSEKAFNKSLKTK